MFSFILVEANFFFFFLKKNRDLKTCFFLSKKGLYLCR
uniref:Uncharacterized protein n=1 Tax=viral metagenome TaxID=1070528 RepID=A0A6C0K2Z9_9ZZZZ